MVPQTGECCFLVGAIINKNIHGRSHGLDLSDFLFDHGDRPVIWFTNIGVCAILLASVQEFRGNSATGFPEKTREILDLRLPRFLRRVRRSGLTMFCCGSIPDGTMYREATTLNMGTSTVVRLFSSRSFWVC